MNVKRHEFMTNLVNSLQFEIADSGYADIDDEWNEAHLCSPFTRLYYIESGTGILQTPEEDIVLYPNHVYLVPTEFLFNTRCDSHMKKLYFHVILKDIRGLDLFNGCRNVLNFSVNSSRIQKLCGLYSKKDMGNAALLKAEIFHDFSHFLTMAGFHIPSAVSPYLQQLYRAAQNPISARNTVRRLAELLNMSQSTLSKTFKRDTGITLDHYLNTLLLNRSCQLLLVSHMSISEIASSLSFCDPYYFSRYFKKNTGVTPSLYRKQRLNESRNFSIT